MMDPCTCEYRLTLRARDGDREAVAELVERTRLRLFALAYAELRHYDDAQDALAAGLLQICLHIGEVREPARVVPWMQRIVRREARRLRRGPDMAPLHPEEPDPREDIPTLLLRLDIEQALRQLPGRQAQALRLFYQGGLSVREIAARMGGPEDPIPEGRVKIWLHRGRQQLATEMKGYAPMTQTSSTTQAAPLRPAALLHTDLTPNVIQTVKNALRDAGFEPRVLTPNDLPGPQANQLLLRDALKGYHTIVVDEEIGGRPGLEYVLFCKAFPETLNIRLTLLHSGEPNPLMVTACFTAGTRYLARKDDPKSLAAALHPTVEGSQGSWENFTERARKIVLNAQEEAIALGDNYVSTEHLLLGLVREADSAGARILVEKCGIPLKRIRDEVSRHTERGTGSGEDMMLTPRGMNVVDFSNAEAQRLGHDYIASEHLLLGLISEFDGLAGRVLAGLGVDLDKTRAFVAEWQKA